MPQEKLRTLESRLIAPIIFMVFTFFIFVFLDIYFVNHILSLQKIHSHAEKITWQIEKTDFYCTQYFQDKVGNAELVKESLEDLKAAFQVVISESSDPELETVVSQTVHEIDAHREDAFTETQNEKETHNVFIGRMNAFVTQSIGILNHHIKVYRKWLYVDLAASVLMAIVIMILTVLTIRRGLSQPIRQLIKTIERVSKGSIEDRVAIPDTYELALLARTFNDMADAVYKSRTDLMIQRDRLEADVAKRTGELLKLNEELQRSNKELDDFTYTVSHDLKEPLRAISVFTGLLKSECYDNINADGQESVDIILGASGRMKKLIEDLLEISRITRRRNPPTTISINGMTSEIIGDLALVIREKNAKIEQPKNDITLQGDAIRIKQLLTNLIGNGLKFNRSDVPCVQISTMEGIPQDAPSKPARPAEYVTISVEDNGIGIAPEYHNTVFEIFQRLVSREEFDGTGAGLAICKKIVEDHGGKIWIQSNIEQDTTFFVMLPVKAIRGDEK